MKMTVPFFFFLGAVLVGAAGSSKSGEAGEKTFTMQDRLEAYHLGLFELFENAAPEVQQNPDHCRPNILECTRFVAGQHPTDSERVQAAKSCTGNFGTSCVEFVSGSYPTFQARAASARACAGNFDSQCAKFVAGQYPTPQERISAAEACRFAEADCVKFVAGQYPTPADRIRAAKACGSSY